MSNDSPNDITQLRDKIGALEIGVRRRDRRIDELEAEVQRLREEFLKDIHTFVSDVLECVEGQK